MIRIRIEVVPGGHQDLAYEIGTAEIINIGEFREEYEYRYEIRERPRSETTKGWKIRRGSVTHRREDGVWDLIARAIRHAQKKSGVG